MSFPSEPAAEADQPSAGPLDPACPPGRDLGWLLGLVGVGLVLWAPLLLGRALLQRDMLRFAWPARAFLGQSLRSGELPMWFPSIGLGLSAFADPLLGIFYPPNFLFALDHGPVAVTALWLVHLLFGALGLFLLARALGARGVGAFVAGVAWLGAGFTVSESTAGFRLLAEAYLPWMGYLFLRLARAQRVSSETAAAGLLVGVAFLLGEYFTATIDLVFAGLFVLAVRSTEAPRGKRRQAALSASLRMAAASLLGVALAAVALLPSLFALPETPRAHELSRDLAEGWSVHPGRLVELLIPRVFGVSWMSDALSPWVGHYFGGAAPLSLSLYLGAGVVLLTLLAWAGPRRLLVVILGIGLVGVLLALGQHTPVHQVWRVLVPPLAHARYPEKYLVIVVFAVALGAGLGAGAVTSLRRLFVTASALLAVIAVCAAAPCSLFDCALAPALRTGAMHAGAVLAAAVGALAIRRRWPREGNLLLALLVAGDLVFAARGLMRFSSVSGPPALAQAMLAQRPTMLPPTRFYRGQRVHDSVAQARAIPPSEVALASLRDNVSVVWGLSILPGYNAGFAPRLTRLLESRRSDLPRLLSADFVLLSQPGPVPPGFVPVAEIPGARLYTIEHALPRVYAAASAQVEAENTDLYAEDILQGRRVVLPAPMPQPLSPSPARAGTCNMSTFSANHLAAECQLDQPAMIVFVEQYAPGWQAELDGRAVPVVRANSVMRAVWSPAGSHRVELRFRPPGLRLGAIVSACAGTLFIVLLLWGRRRRRVPIPSAGVAQWPVCPSGGEPMLHDGPGGLK